MWNRSRMCVGVLIACCLAPVPAFASDGTIEINQARAQAGGVTPGDAPGFPVTLSQPGSYRLTGDLVVPTADTTAVQIAAGPATLDLGGFSIRGVVSCSGVPVASCAPLGAGVGVLGGDFVTVRNGSVVGMGSDGIRLRYGGLVEDVLSLSNGGAGIAVADQAIVRGNRATSNGAHGIQTSIEATVDHNSAVANHLAGIFVTSGVVTGNTATRNGAEGANLGTTTAFSDNLLGHDPGNVASLSVVGGRATGGNSCDDGRCSSRGTRRFYLSSGSYHGDQARFVCASGFHMASLYEVWDPSGLAYDTRRGYAGGDGAPPVSAFGWLATGGLGTDFNAAGQANCLGWGSASSQAWGSLGQLNSGWTYFGTGSTPPTLASPWLLETDTCDKGHGVWCVED